MGGLVIKKAYILARQFQEFQQLASRVRAIFFLATPHRGSDLASLLTKILQLSGARPFVTDLHRNSLATQSINDEFPQHCQDLVLYSFYETLPTNYGVGKGLIVEKDMAVLNIKNERTVYLNANHRDICKYATTSDSNYVPVRNALASVIETFRHQAVVLEKDLDNEHRRLLDSYLDISDAPDDDFMRIDQRRMKGSCEWLMRKDSFQSWRDSITTQILWISAKPATGKSVLSAYVINHLKDRHKDTAFHFFNHGDSLKSTISFFLRSVAWQMALKHPEVLRTILEISESNPQIGTLDYRTIWRKLFLDGIFKVKFNQPQYWVVDALDESKSEPELVPLLLKTMESSPIRIFVTTRNRFDSYRPNTRLRMNVIIEGISELDTKSDITMYLEANMEYLPSVDEVARQQMVDKILLKSGGCFLWVSLVLQELRQVHTSTEIRKVLEDVPSDMDELYSRILESMSRAPYGKLLAKAILTWTVCAARSLSTDELHHALEIDIKDKIEHPGKSIPASCGQLVYIDAQSYVQMVHQTARDFLLRHDMDSEFKIDRKIGHKRLAMTCLEYLNSSEMKSGRPRKISASIIPQGRCAFANYAGDSLFEHVTHVSSTDDDILEALARFLTSPNVLTWIEYIAQKSNLNHLIHTGKAFHNYLHRRSKHMSPFGKEVATLDRWATDLVRLVTKFGKILLACPSSIYQLIPPFCPPESAVKKQFAGSTRGITVHGISATGWDDCLSTIVYQQQQVSALACSDQYFAVGISKGDVFVYHQSTCQEASILKHREHVKILHFGPVGKTLISSGMKIICVWDVFSWQRVWRFDTSAPCLSLTLIDEDRILLGALRNNILMFWDLTTGLLNEAICWTQELEEENARAFRRPIAAAFSVELGLLAVVYRGQDIFLWDIENDALYDTYNKDSGSSSTDRRVVTAGVLCIAFSTAPASTLLAASYSDGDLVLFNTSQGAILEMTTANAQTLACSPDGRTLASGDSAGTIQLYDFETLKLLYRIHAEEYVKSVAFSGDSQRLLDIRGSHCRIWDPMVLVRQDVDDEYSDTVSISTTAQEFALEPIDELVLITALACHENGEVFFCGKEDGSVYLYETESGQQHQKLFSHANGVSILSLFFDTQSHILSSTDSSSRVTTHKLIRKSPYDWEATEVRFDHRMGVAVDQILSNRGHTRMLVSASKKDTLFSILPDGDAVVETISWEDRGPYRWASHPANQDQLILICDNVAHLYEWNTLRKLTGAEGVLLEGAILPELAIRSITPCFDGAIIATAFAKSTGADGKSKLALWNTSDFNVGSETATPVPKYQYLADQVEFLIGNYGQRLVFLHAGGWICSTDPKTFGITRHFFIPSDWLITSGAVMIEVTRYGDIIYVKRDEVAVIKRGLMISEAQPSHGTGKRPSLAAPRQLFGSIKKLGYR